MVIEAELKEEIKAEVIKSVEIEIQPFKEMAERLNTSYPPKGAIDLFIGGSLSLASGTRATIVIDIQKGWLAKVKSIYVDHRDNTNYKFSVGGENWEVGNEADFTIAQEEKEKIIIIIENVSASTLSYTFNIKGWGEQQ